MIPFAKAHACGNDFLIVDAKFVEQHDRRAVAIRLCARNTGVGADGVEYLDWNGDRAAARIQLFNADGSIAEISGNGTRCVAAWMAYKQRAGAGDVFAIETDVGVRQCRIASSSEHRFDIATGMGTPEIAQRGVELAGGRLVQGAVVSMGNPHFVIFVGDDRFAVAQQEWESIGREICFHRDFPQQTNVEFVHVIGPGEIEIRIFERGVGATTSSGTGTCATAAASIALRGLNSELRVRAPGGSQLVNWAGGSAEMTLTGPAELIAVGEAF